MVTMETAQLGKAGIKVSKIIFGAMTIGSKRWHDWVVEEEEALKLLKYAYDQGIRTFDTADIYSNGDSERIIGKFLKVYNIDRRSVVILSKCYYCVMGDYYSDFNSIEWANIGGLSRRAILDAAAASVERLGTYIDVLQIHRLDKSVPYEEIMKALHDVVESGQARYIGASSMKATEFAQLQFAAEKNGWTKFISMQSLYNAIYREEEREMFPFCEETGVGLIPWSPLARGVLARPLSQQDDTTRSKSDVYTKYLKLGTDGSDATIINRIEELAKKKGVTMAQIGIAWVIAKGVTAPIVGMGSIKRIDEAVAALKIKLTDEEIAYIDEPYEAHPFKL